MIFKVTAKSVREDNDSIDAIPEFRLINDTGLKAIFLYYDYDSPFSKVYVKDRWNKVFKALGYNGEADGLLAMQKAHKKKWDIAIDTFNSLQVDVEKEMLQSYTEQLAQWIELMKKKDKSDKENDFCLKLTKEMGNLIRDKRELEKLISGRDVKVESPDVKRSLPSIADD